VTHTLCAVADTYVAAGSPYTNFGSDTDLVVGFGGGQNEPFAKRVLVRFDLGLPSGAKVTGAQLRLGMTNAAFSGAVSLSVYPVAADWDETVVTWATQPAVSGSAVAQATASTTVPQTVAWDVTTLVQGWADGTVASYGLEVRGPESGVSDWWRMFDSRHYMPTCPSLVVSVESTSPWPTPTPTPPPTPTPTPTPMCQPPDAAGDTSATAATLTPFTAVTEYICPNGDEDWWKISVTKNQGIQVYLDDLPNDYGVALRKPDNSEAGHSWQTDADDFIAYKADSTGDWYVQVTGMGTWSSDPYTLRVDVCGAPDEAGDYLANATEITLGLTQYGYLCPAGDVDYYTFNVPADQRVTVTATLSNLPADYGVTIYDAVGYSRAANLTKGTGTKVAEVGPDVYATEVAGAWRVRVQANGSAAESPLKPYALVVEVTTDANLTLSAIDVVQVTTEANPVTLVKGKPVMVRAFAALSGYAESVDGVEAALWGWTGCEGCSALPGSPMYSATKTVSTGEVSEKRASLESSFNFILPSSWQAVGDIYLEAEVNPGRDVIESDYTDNTMQVVATFVDRYPITVWLLQVEVGGTVVSFNNNTDFTDMMALLRAMYPVSKVNYFIWPGFYLKGDHDYADQSSGGCGDGWRDLLDDLQDVYDDLWTNRPTFQAFVYGVLPAINSPNVGGCGIVGEPVAAGGATGNTLAHEVGHNFGRNHAPSDRDAQGTVTNSECGDPDDEDSSYPQYTSPIGDRYARSSIGKVGVNVQASVYWPTNSKFPTIWNPATTYDVMSYCSPKWISPYTYDAIMAKIINSATTLRATSAATPHLIAAGRVKGGHVAKLRPFWVEPQPPEGQGGPGEGPYSLELQDAAGTALFVRHFDPRDPYHGTDPDSGSFHEILPYHPATARVVFRRQGEIIHQAALSAHAPTVTLLTPHGGETWSGAGPHIVAWNASDADGDPLTAKVLYSADDGADWQAVAVNVKEQQYILDGSYLGGSEHARIQVLVSDGLRTASDVSDGSFRVTEKPPHVMVLSPRADAVLSPDGALVLEGAATDPEDGPLSDSALSWSSDVAGPLGTGSGVIVQAPVCGSQTITLAATDSSGTVGTASVAVGRCCFKLAPAGISYGMQGGHGDVTVESGFVGCAWEAVSDVPWIVITSGGRASGDGTVTYTVLPFTERGTREGRITVGDRSLIVTQSGPRPRIHHRLHR
jgi:hypothetical protein